MKHNLSPTLLLLFIIFLTEISDGNGQGFVSNPGIPNPKITFLNDSVVRLDYDSIYQVHESYDTIQYPGSILRDGFSGKYDYVRIFSDLMTVLDAREYHFIPIYSDEDLRYGEVPGWIHSGSRNKFPAKNIGRNNNSVDEYHDGVWPERGNNYAMLHMNNLEFLDRPIGNLLGQMPNWGSTLTLFHEIGHTWSVNWITTVAVPLGWTPVNWQPWMPTIALVAGGSHWWSYNSDRWIYPANGGLLTSAPSINRFNIFDLYAMGALPYQDIVDSVLYVRDPNTLITYPINVDSLRLTLIKAQYYLDTTPQDDLPIFLQGTEFMEGDGMRIPATDPNTQNFKTLIVLVTGKESVFTESDEDLILKLARDVPPDWDIATRNYSRMSTKLEHKMINDITVLIPIDRDEVNINFQDFAAGYNPYIKKYPDSIRIESLPLKGILTYNGVDVSIGQVFSVSDFSHFNYQKTIPKPDEYGDEFTWNVIVNGRQAVPARVKIVDQSAANQLAGKIEPSGKKESKNKAIGKNGTIVKVFPNPFGKTLKLSVTNSSNVYFKIVLYDMQGNTRFQKTIHVRDVGTNTIQIDNIPDDVTGLLNLAITLDGNTSRMTILRNSLAER